MQAITRNWDLELGDELWSGCQKLMEEPGQAGLWEDLPRVLKDWPNEVVR